MLWKQRLKAKAEADGTIVTAKRQRETRADDVDDDDDGAERYSRAAA